MPCDRQDKIDTRIALSNWFHSLALLPWILAGDFNATVSLNERAGCVGDTVDSASFVDWIDVLNLSDMGYSGQPFTWSGGVRRARLDRFLALDDWFNLFPLFETSALAFLGSDHRPIMINSISHASIRRRFHYEICWEKEEDFMEMVHRAWCSTPTSTNAITSLVAKLREV